MSRLFKTILVPVDGSEPSNAALTVACGLAKQFGGAVHARHILAMHPQLSGRHVNWLPEDEADERRNATGIARAAENLANQNGVPVDVQVLDGDPIEQLLLAAVVLRADSIVIGNRGQTALSSLLLGSVAQGVTEHCRLPVLVVHELPLGSDSETRGVMSATTTR